MHELEASGAAFPPDVIVGTTLSASATFTSRGEPGTGLAIAVFGDAIDRGLMSVEAIRVVAGDGSHDATLRERQAGDGRTIWTGELPDVSFGGPVEDGDPTVRVVVEAQARAAGDADCTIRLMVSPTVSADGQLAVRTLRAPPRPLRLAEQHERPEERDEALENLAGQDTQLALLVLDEEDGVAFSVARDLFGEWMRTVGTSQDVLECSLSYPGGVSKQTRHLRPDAYPTRDGWTTIMGAFREVEALAWRTEIRPTAPTFAVDENAEVPHAYGLSCVRDRPGYDGASHTFLPHLLLWQTGGDDQLEVLTRLVRSVVGRSDLVQAVVARCKHVPDLREATPYETVCGIGPGGQWSQEWTGRWLRWCAHQTWLGSSLAARVGDLSSFTASERHGVTELSTDDLAGLETALASVLPSRADWTNAQSA